MDEKAKEYALKAINMRIKRLGEHIVHCNTVVRETERELRTKQVAIQNIGGFGVSMQYDESTSSRHHKEYTEKKAVAEKNLEGYKHAKEAIENL